MKPGVYIICFSKNCTVYSYDGFVGGSYSATPPSTTSGYPYARLLNDRGGVFSQLNYYDRLGRVVVNQNTKEHNYKTPEYEYVLYDALNRQIESGQKTENKDAINFNTVFGDTVMGFYNPNIINPNKYLAWIKDNSGPRTQVIHNYYDVQSILPNSVLIQQQLLDAISSITYSDTLRSDSLIYNNAVHYSYDVHGYATTIIQDNQNTINNQRYKRTDYQYDLISNKINEIDYQNDSIDQYHQEMSYDGDNRLIQIRTSKDSIMWDCDAKYFYYAHDKLARVEIGDQQIQGIDYVYTLQGWKKGFNSDQLDGAHDMGCDAEQVTGNLNRYFARDAIGYTLTYFDKSSLIPGDYDAINSNMWNTVTNRFQAYTYGSDLTNSRRDLYNANISALSTTITQPTNYKIATQPTILPQGTAYNYDQLNRLIDMKAYQNLNTTTNTWGTSGTYNGLYHNWLTYDANGNILTQKRADSVGEVFDSLTYRYNNNNGVGPTIQNRLYHVNDVANVSTIHDDIKDEGTFNSTELTINQKNNYRYNSLGELAKDTIGGIDTIIWTSRHKVWKIRKFSGDSIIFTYDGQSRIVSKEFRPISGSPVTTFYIYDAEKHIQAIYIEQSVSSKLSYTLTERELYGTSRIGSDKTNIQLIGAVPVALVDTFNRYLGGKQYELDNYLGSVLAVVSDRKIPRPDNTGSMIDHYEPDVISANDYYPFGMLESGRNFSPSSYRFAFNGKEKEDEVYGSADAYDYGHRMYDPRLGRFLSRDPLANEFADLTPYQYASNNPIMNSDIDGDEALPQNPKEWPLYPDQAIVKIVSIITISISVVDEKVGVVTNPTTVAIPQYINNAQVLVTAGGNPYSRKEYVAQEAMSWKLDHVEKGQNVYKFYNGEGSHQTMELPDIKNGTTVQNVPGSSSAVSLNTNGFLNGQSVKNSITALNTNLTNFYNSNLSNQSPGCVQVTTINVSLVMDPNDPNAKNIIKSYNAMQGQMSNDLEKTYGNNVQVSYTITNAQAGAAPSLSYTPTIVTGASTSSVTPVVPAAPAPAIPAPAAPASATPAGTGGGNNGSGKTSCFVAGTEISIARGKLKNIEEIKIGDSVETMDPITMQIINERVYKIVCPIHNNLVKISFNGKFNMNTFDHPYFVKGKEWCSFKPQLTEQNYGINVKQLEKGDTVYQYDEGILKEIEITSIAIINTGDIQMYNIFLEGDNNNYFANGILVSSEELSNNESDTSFIGKPYKRVALQK